MSPFEDIRKENVLEWLSWSLYDRELHEIRHPQSNDRIDFLEQAFTLIEARSGQAIPQGRNPDMKILRLTMDPMCAGTTISQVNER
jgi:hypothetical protein